MSQDKQTEKQQYPGCVFVVYVCVFVCVCVCVSMFVGSKNWNFTHSVVSDNLCGDDILDPTTWTLNFRVKIYVLGIWTEVRLMHKLVKVRVRVWVRLYKRMESRPTKTVVQMCVCVFSAIQRWVRVACFMCEYEHMLVRERQMWMDVKSKTWRADAVFLFSCQAAFKALWIAFCFYVNKFALLCTLSWEGGVIHHFEQHLYLCYGAHNDKLGSRMNRIMWNLCLKMLMYEQNWSYKITRSHGEGYYWILRYFL